MASVASKERLALEKATTLLPAAPVLHQWKLQGALAGEKSEGENSLLVSVVSLTKLP